MSTPLQLVCTLNTATLPVTDRPRLVYLLAEVSGESGPAPRPVNLSLVVDVSESMHIRIATDEEFRELARTGALREVLVDGVPAWRSADIPAHVMTRLPRKIDRVRDALRAAIEQLRPGDRLSLTAFARQATTLIPNTAFTGQPDERRRLLGAVNGIDGLQLGDDTCIGRGMALGLEEARKGMAAGDVVTRLLVLTDGFTLDEDECRRLAAQARQARIPISTMGLGGEFNEELMIPIADQTGGEAYLLSELEEIQPAFAREMARAQAVRYRNVELKLRPAQGVEVRAAYRVRPAIAPLETLNEGGSYSFPLGDMAAGESPALLLELLSAPRPAGVYRLAQAVLAADDGRMGVKIRADVVTKYAAGAPTDENGRVAAVLAAVSAYKLQRRANADLAAGDVAGATRRLRAAATRLLEMGEEELAAEVQQQIAALENRGQPDPNLTKKLSYETRKLGDRD